MSLTKRKAEDYLEAVSKAVKRRNNQLNSTSSYPLTLSDHDSIVVSKVHSALLEYFCDKHITRDYCSALSTEQGYCQIILGARIFAIPLSNLFLVHDYIFSTLVEKNNVATANTFMELWFVGLPEIRYAFKLTFDYTVANLHETFRKDVSEEEWRIYLVLTDGMYKRFIQGNKKIYYNIKKSFVFSLDFE